VRIVRTPSGSVVVDGGGKLSGRGAYLCQTPDCFQAGLARQLLLRALKLEHISEDDLEALNVYAQRLSSSSTPQ
jgi:predicted RNA-binding protein YlxR (DUF448 family)